MANVATLSARAAFDVSAFQSGTQKMLAGLSQIRAAVKATEGDTKGMQSQADSAGGSVGSLNSVFLAGGVAGAAFAAANKLVSISLDGIKTAANAAFRSLKFGASLSLEAERSEKAFEVMLGSAEKARDMMKNIEAFAVSTPFDTKGVTDNVVMLQGMGIATEELIPTLKTLGDMSLGNRDKLTGLSLAYGQVMAKGKLMSQEFNQLAERGINLREALAKELGVGVEDVAKQMELGKISARTFKNALVELANSKFNNAMFKDEETSLGKMAMLTDKFGISMKKLFEDINKSDWFKKGIDSATGLLEVLDRARPALTVNAISKVNQAGAAVNHGIGVAGMTIEKIGKGIQWFRKDNIGKNISDAGGFLQGKKGTVAGAAKWLQDKTKNDENKQKGLEKTTKGFGETFSGIGTMIGSNVSRVFGNAMESVAAKMSFAGGYISNATDSVAGMAIPGDAQSQQRKASSAVVSGSGEDFSMRIARMLNKPDEEKKIPSQQLEELKEISTTLGRIFERGMFSGANGLDSINGFLGAPN